VLRLSTSLLRLAGGTIKGLRERSANPPPPWDADLPKPKGQTVASFRRGLITFPKGLAARLGDRVKTSWTLSGVERAPDGTYRLTYDTPDGSRVLSSRAVIFTLPAHAFAPLLRVPSPPTAEALDSFYYPPVGAVTVAYPESAIREDRLAVGGGKLAGFGQLHPRSQGITTLGTIYSSALFPNRAPAGQVLLLNYIGGAKNTAIATMKEADIVAQVDKDLRTMLLRPDAPPPRVLGVRVWPRAIPQFNVGHLDVLARARDALASRGWSGTFLGGNYAAGVALGRCVEGAYESAAEVATWLAAPTVR
jgi:oxygen-dependent protoporphyrinogen oxidase